MSAFSAGTKLMPAAASTQRILVKARSGGSPITFEAEPLFESIGRGDAFGAVPGKTWYMLKPAIAISRTWDLCHPVVRDGFGAAAGRPEFAEPDFPRHLRTVETVSPTMRECLRRFDLMGRYPFTEGARHDWSIDRNRRRHKSPARVQSHKEGHREGEEGGGGTGAGFAAGLAGSS